MNYREFTGVFITAPIYQDKSLHSTAKMLWAEINALSQTKPCTASNSHFADHLGIDPRSVQRSLDTLEKLGYVKRIVFDGYIRHLYAVIPQSPALQKIIRGGDVNVMGGGDVDVTLNINDKYNDIAFSKENDISARGARQTPTSLSFSKKKNLATPPPKAFVYEDGSIASASGNAYLETMKRNNLPRYERSLEYYRKWVREGKKIKTTHEKLLQWIINQDLGEKEENAKRNRHYANTMIVLYSLNNIKFTNKSVVFFKDGKLFESIELNLNCDSFKRGFNAMSGLNQIGEI